MLGGYFQGGLFCFEAAAYRRCACIDSVIAFGAPLDFSAGPLPIPISLESYIHLAQAQLDSKVLDHASLPGWFNKSWTRLLNPVATVRGRLRYLSQLHDREKLLPGEQQRAFLDSRAGLPGQTRRYETSCSKP